MVGIPHREASPSTRRRHQDQSEYALGRSQPDGNRESILPPCSKRIASPSRHAGCDINASGKACMLGLDPTKSGTVQFWGNSTAVFNQCNVVSNSLSIVPSCRWERESHRALHRLGRRRRGHGSPDPHILHQRDNQSAAGEATYSSFLYRPFRPLAPLRRRMARFPLENIAED